MSRLFLGTGRGISRREPHSGVPGVHIQRRGGRVSVQQIASEMMDTAPRRAQRVQEIQSGANFIPTPRNYFASEVKRQNSSLTNQPWE